MALTTIDSVGLHAPKKHGFFARLMDRLAEGQMHKARALAKPHLLALDDDALASLGHKREDVMRWGSGGR